MMYDGGPPPLVPQREAAGMSIPPPPGAAGFNNDDRFFGAFPNHNANHNAGATPRWGQGGLSPSPFESLSSFPSPGGQSPWAAGWEAVGGIGGQAQWQDSGANQWPMTPRPQGNHEGFRTTAWPGEESPTPFMSGQPNGEGFAGGGRPRTMTPTNPYSTPYGASPHTPNQLSLPIYNNAFAGYPGNGPVSAPLSSSPPMHDNNHRRALSLSMRKKQRDQGWYPTSNLLDYGPTNLAQRPRDWNQDFELHPSLFKKVAAPKNRSDIKEFPDPIKRILHPHLLYVASRPPLNYDIRFNPLADTAELTLFNNLGRPFNDVDLLQLSTTPAAPFMRLYHARYPWYIDVHSRRPNGITIGDILSAVHRSFSAPIESRHYWCEDLTSDDRQKLDTTYYRRCGQDQETLSKGVTRGDFLAMQGLLRLDGLVRGRLGMWEMKIGAYGHLAP